MTPRRGVSLIEMTVAAAILAAVATATIRMWMSVQHQQRQTARRLQALQIADNLMEQATAIQFQHLDSGRLQRIRLPQAAWNLLPSPALQWSLLEHRHVPAAKRIRLTVSWNSRTSPSRRSAIGLTSWLYEQAATRPDEEPPP